MINLASSTAIVFLFLVAASVGTVVFADEASQETEVIDVIDATTIIISYGGDPVSCVYIGVFAPESESPLSSTISKARQFNKDLVEGKTVRLEFDEQKYDKYGRLLAYVYCDDVFVNAELIRQGYGSVMVISPNTRYAERFLKLEREAREAKRGLWAEQGTMDAPTQSVTSLGKQIALMAEKIEELSSKIDQLFEIIKKLQLQRYEFKVETGEACSAQSTGSNASIPNDQPVSEKQPDQSHESDLAARAPHPEAKININTATQSELESLPRIGPVLAQRIIDYRQKHGKFKSIDELKDVKGIADATLQRLKDFITVEGSDESD